MQYNLYIYVKFKLLFIFRMNYVYTFFSSIWLTFQIPVCAYFCIIKYSPQLYKGWQKLVTASTYFIASKEDDSYAGYREHLNYKDLQTEWKTA